MRAFFLMSLAILFMVAAMTEAYVWGVQDERGRAVCHAPTEDSRIVDCDYRNGGWYRK